MEEAWAQLDGETVEKEVTKAFKTMAKAAKTFAARDLPACAENSVTFRDEVAAFREFVPLVQALRNPGMRERHWAQLSERLGVDLRPDRADTLSRAQVRVPPALISLASRCIAAPLARNTRMPHAWRRRAGDGPAGGGQAGRDQ